jgi:hypothetical protein
MKETISKTVDKWIKEEIGRPAILRVIRANDPWEGMSEEEIEDAREFIRWYVNKDFAVLLLIPTPPRENDFWYSDYEEFQESAFNTHDFQALQRPFNKYAYRIKKIVERVKDLAILYSCISSDADREDTRSRYDNLVSHEFRNRLLYLVEKHRKESDEDERFLLRRKIAELNRRILECKILWEKYSRWE